MLSRGSLGKSVGETLLLAYELTQFFHYTQDSIQLILSSVDKHFNKFYWLSS
jgi:hypothetical protein